MVEGGGKPLQEALQHVLADPSFQVRVVRKCCFSDWYACALYVAYQHLNSLLPCICAAVHANSCV